LSVTTFSLSILTAAYATASSGSTPRSVRLLVRDATSQTVLATFIGAFVFSLVGLIMLKTKLYGEEGRVMLFAVTLVVIALVILSLLRWISRLGEMGLVGDTVSQLEKATVKALCERVESPWLGANPLRGAPPDDAWPVFPDSVGYMQHADMGGLSKKAEAQGLTIFLLAEPGDFVHPGLPAMVVRGPADDQCDDAEAVLLSCLTIRPERDYRQDPRFGLATLSEVAQRALSPAVNDPATAVDVCRAVLRVLSHWRHPLTPEVIYPRIYLKGLDAEELIRQTLLPLARDGAQNHQMLTSLLQVIHGLALIGPSVYGAAARRLSRDVLSLAQTDAMLPQQVQDLRRVADWGLDPDQRP
ncbi:MAG: DUF2254 domain-containing protein, partial [Paracoccus sp. (in: a-proteobacteria)]|nr:DUF2254 domain-containing protein [Paracoccus sp. (in: a-proteobacteria)]